jgi:hypothetical protein
MDAGTPALDRDGALATIRALAGSTEPEAWATLVDYLDAEPAVAGAAAEALGACGPPALDMCIAALRTPERTRFAAMAIARIGPDGPAAVALWRALRGADAPARIAIAAALHRAPRPAPAALATWFRDETDERVLRMLLDLFGRLPAGSLDAATLARIIDHARSAPSPFTRALATWSAATHALDALIPIAIDHLADPIAGAALVAYVARRRGPLEPLVDGFPIQTGIDPSWDLLDGLTALAASTPRPPATVRRSHDGLPRRPRGRP